MPKFKAGDRVIRTAPGIGVCKKWEIYTIKSCSEHNCRLVEEKDDFTYTPDFFDLVSSDLPTDRPLTYDETQMLKPGDVINRYGYGIVTVLSVSENEIKHTPLMKGITSWGLSKTAKNTCGDLYFVSRGKAVEEVKPEVKPIEAIKKDFEKEYDIKFKTEKEKVTEIKSVAQILYGRR